MQQNHDGLKHMHEEVTFNRKQFTSYLNSPHSFKHSLTHLQITLCSRIPARYTGFMEIKCSLQGLRALAIGP